MRQRPAAPALWRGRHPTGDCRRRVDAALRELTGASRGPAHLVTPVVYEVGYRSRPDAATASARTTAIELTVRTDDPFILRALASRWAGVMDESASTALLEAVRIAFEGPTMHLPARTPGRAPRRPAGGHASELTARELDVLVLIAAGFANKQIALSLDTVRNHAQNILYKLGAHSKLEAVATAMRAGILSHPAVADGSPERPSTAEQLVSSAVRVRSSLSHLNEG